jgi:hypothetical protein
LGAAWLEHELASTDCPEAAPWYWPPPATALVMSMTSAHEAGAGPASVPASLPAVPALVVDVAPPVSVEVDVDVDVGCPPAPPAPAGGPSPAAHEAAAMPAASGRTRNEDDRDREKGSSMGADFST